MLDHEQIFHFSKATLLAGVATLLLVFHQIRHTFHETREAFVAFQRQKNRNKPPKKGKKAKKSASDDNEDDGIFVVAFFHPRCSDGGGGERVLWKSIQALGEMKEGKFIKRRTKMKKENSSSDLSGVKGKVSDAILTNCRNLSVVVYTIDEPHPNYDKEVMEKVRERFSIVMPSSLSVHFVHLHEVKDLLNKPKRLTMVAETWGTMKLAWYALSVVTPHVYIDTTGCAFTFVVAKILAGCKVATYVHYPTISTDMLSLVWQRRPSYNNNSQITTNPFITYAKLFYYAAFAICYGFVGSLADLTMVNSSWTKGHIQYLWKFAGEIHVVFPPVNTKSLKDLSTTGRENIIISIGQFRPEKDHTLQLQSFAKLLEMHDGAMKKAGVKLYLIGSCRGEDDQERVDQLQKLARELGVQGHVSFVLNQPHSVLKDYFRRASVGIHTMWNEHFGIGVVEMMSAGLVTVAHKSGGPKSDIILRPWDFEKLSTLGSDKPTGCLASTAEEYARAQFEVLKKDPLSDEILQIREDGRISAGRFSDEVFMDSFKETVLPLFRNRPRLIFFWQE
mmetsp:Transcript_15604/g.34072  ORF Transcript_15604/g.34072 Transcript_15604/m.34072 type:complete len:561 (+) Transcript_15604:136-1818(+)